MTTPSVHVAAMPFPSPQGTQASIAAMLEALCVRGDTPELWTYAHGTDVHSANTIPTPYRVQRLHDFPRDTSLRSGPSWRKVLLDAQLTAHLALSKGSTPVVAHHVEAALAALLARRPFVFFAHTDLAAELPSYAPGVWTAPLNVLGATLDRLVVQHALHVAAISPGLALHLANTYRRDVHYVPTPWPTAPIADEHDRAHARDALGIAQHMDVVLYAGNLDAYQGWSDVVTAVAIAQRARPSLTLLVATQSDAAPLRSLAQQHGIGARVVIAPLADEADRQRCHAASDVAVIPRRVPGGLPIKLLDALSRGVAVIATERAVAGLPLGDAATIVTDDAPHAIAHALSELLPHALRRHAQIDAGSAYLRAHHSRSKFFAAFDAARGG